MASGDTRRTTDHEEIRRWVESLLYQDEASTGEESRFNKLVSRRE